MKVEVVLVEDFVDVTAFILELTRCDIKGYKPPSRRLQQFWQELTRRFRRRQEEIARELDHQFRKELQPILGLETTLSLWLSDGRGSLVRFAAHDRIHRSLDALRRIPYRFDTGWAVTEAVSSGNFVLRELKRSPEHPEHAVPDQRWKAVAAEPLWLTSEGGPSLVAGALVSTSAVLNKKIAKPWWEAMKRLARFWEARISRF